MHYANGREAKIGDKVVGVDLNGAPIAGTVVETYPETDRCNLILVPATAPTYTTTASCCMHVTDAIPRPTAEAPFVPEDAD